MTVAEAKQRTYTLASGESDEPDTDTEALILLYLNIFKDRWAKEPNVDWNSLRSIATLTDTVTATDTFALEDGDGALGKISKQEGDYVSILHTNGTSYTNYTIVPASKLYTTAEASPVAVMGGNLVFATPFTATSPQFGGTIRVPQFEIPADYTSDDDVITVDDPDFICFMAAAEIAANDVTKSDQAPRLLAYAADSMQAMKENNEAQSDEIYNDYNPLTWAENE